MEKFFDINEAGCSIRCMMYCSDPRDIRRVILYGHGFGGHKENRAAGKFADRILTKYKHIAVLCFDWPCHGEDGRKKMVLEDCLTYLELIVDYCRRRFGTEELYNYSTSFGGYLTLLYIHKHGNPFRRITLRCPAIRMHDVLMSKVIPEEEQEKLAKGKDVLVGFDRKVKINPQFMKDLEKEDLMAFDFVDYAEDILILRGTKDEIIPAEDIDSFCDKNIIECVPITNADHRFSDPNIMELATQHITDFMSL